MIDFRRLPRLFKTCFKVQDRHRPDLLVPFEPNSAQIDLLHLCQKVQEQKQLVWIIAIKPRRVGLSRVITGIGASMSFFYPGMRGRIMAHLGSTLDELMVSLSLMVEGLPLPVAPKVDMRGYRAEVGVGREKSLIAGSKALSTGEGRGGAASFMQLTEAAYYPINSPFTAMLPLVPRNRATFVGIESTPSPDRRGIAFKEMWDQARWIDERRRDALFVRYFCPWMKDPYAFADPRIAKDAPIDEEEKALLAAGVGREKIAWRRQEIRSRYRGRRELFESENPSDPLSCFAAVDLPAFSLEEREWAKRTITQPMMVANFQSSAADGYSHPIRLKPDEIGLWRIYEEPQKQCEYYLGADAARGLDVRDEKKVVDYSAIVVINGSTGAVAAVMEARIPPDRVAREIALAGRYYRTLEINEYHYSMLNIAITDGFGNEVLRRVRNEYDYPIFRFTRWRGRDDRIHGRPGQNIGWIDTQATNDLRVNSFRIALANQSVFVRDSRLAEQIQYASMSGTDAEVFRGHDDVLDAAMYAWIARDFDPPRKVIDVDQTETYHLKQLFKFANDPDAVFNRLWDDTQKMAHPKKPDALEQMLRYVNEMK